MMAFRFSRSFQLWLLALLKMSFDRLHCVLLLLKLFAFASLAFFFLEICLIIVHGCFWWFLISRLGVVPLVLFLGLVRLFFFFVFFEFEVLKGFRACLVRVLHYFFDFLFPCFALHISMGRSRSFVLRMRNSIYTQIFSLYTPYHTHPCFHPISLMGCREKWMGCK